ncbi:MAG: hypothetical protein ACYC1L_17655 [Alphaproteobacteria bacterium]
MNKTVVVTLTLLAIVAGAGASNAQINPFGKWAQVGFTKEDAEMNQKAAASLYEKPDVKTGEKASWQNPASGNGGTVTTTRIYKYKDMPCVDLLSSLDLKDSQDKSKKEIKSTRCKVTSGEWKILHK